MTLPRQIPASPQFMQKILDSHPSICSVVNEAGQIIMVNDAWRVYGSEHGADAKTRQGIHLNYFDVCNQIPEGDEDRAIAIEFARHLETVLKGDQHEHYVEYQLSADVVSWFAVRIKGFSFEGKRYAIISHNEITAQVIANQKLSQALAYEHQVNHLKSQFFSMVSHEFRTPLAVLMTQIYLLRAHHPDLDIQNGTARLSKMEEMIGNLNELLDELISIGKYELEEVTLHPRMLAVDEFVREIIQDIELTHGLSEKVNLIVRGTLQRVRSDESQIRKIVTNLLTNAVKYTPDPAGSVYVEIETTDDALEISVRDEGIGIPDDAQPKLFNVFFRAENAEIFNGTGLGLVIVKHAVELLQGTIQINSKLGQGTEFSIIIPIGSN